MRQPYCAVRVASCMVRVPQSPGVRRQRRMAIHAASRPLPCWTSPARWIADRGEGAAGHWHGSAGIGRESQSSTGYVRGSRDRPMNACEVDAQEAPRLSSSKMTRLPGREPGRDAQAAPAPAGLEPGVMRMSARTSDARSPHASTSHRARLSRAHFFRSLKIRVPLRESPLYWIFLQDTGRWSCGVAHGSQCRAIRRPRCNAAP
jgi:hypothetical protein